MYISYQIVVAFFDFTSIKIGFILSQYNSTSSRVVLKFASLMLSPMELALRISFVTVNLLLISAELHAQTAYEANLNEVNNGDEVREKFQNLLNSVVGNEMEESGTLRDILKDEVGKGLRDFGAVKEDLWKSRNRDTYKMRNPDHSIVMAAIKREAVQNENNTTLYVEVTEPEYEDIDFTEVVPYDYLKGNRQPNQQFRSADEMYRVTLKHILRMFWSEKCHISEIRFQLNKTNIKPHEKMNQTIDKVITLISDHAETILSILRDNITSSERVEPLGSDAISEMAGLFKELRNHVEKLVPSESASEEAKIIRKEAQLAEEQFVEGYGIVKEMIRNSTLPWNP